MLGLLEERKTRERNIRPAAKLATGGGFPSENGNVTEIAGLKYAPRVMEGIPGKELKSMADEIKKQIGSGVTAIVSVDDGKASIVVGVTDDVTERISAVDLVRVGSAALSARERGRPDMARRAVLTEVPHGLPSMLSRRHFPTYRNLRC